MEDTTTTTRIFRSGGFRGEIKKTDGNMESIIIYGETEGRGTKSIVLKDRWSENLGIELELSDLLELVKKMLEEV